MMAELHRRTTIFIEYCRDGNDYIIKAAKVDIGCSDRVPLIFMGKTDPKAPRTGLDDYGYRDARRENKRCDVFGTMTSRRHAETF